MEENTEKKFTEEFTETVKDKARQGKKGAVKLLFGRTTVILLLIAVQALVLVLASLFLYRYVVYAMAAYSLVALFIVMGILNRPGTPEIQMPWIVMILLVPVFGGFLYLFVQLQPGIRILNKKVIAQTERMKSFSEQDREIQEEICKQNPQMAGMTHYLQKVGFPTYRNNGLTYYPLGDDWYPEILEEMKKARKFIFMEFFIIEHGEVWDHVLEILKDKAAEGVEVRLMYDGTLQFASLSHDYPKRLEAAGIKCKVFSPIKPALTTYQNNRDHRKILVIDGETAFTGGTNLADEYINKKERFGHWKDTAIMVKGDAVKSFTMMFLQLWDLDGYENNYVDYLDIYPRKAELVQPGFVVPYADSPLDGEPVGKFVYMHILQQATKYVHIMTPYLILEHDMITALCDAVRRGVQVRLILPHIPDKVYAFALARTHYKYLISEGVEIYEYVPGFVHAKVFVSDDETAVVGTINMDYRSLFLHFENAVLLYRAEEIDRIEADFEDTLDKCLKVTPEYMKTISTKHKLLGFILKIFAPLM